MAQDIEELSNWLESHKGNTLLIRKEELSTGLQQIFDIDQVTLALDHISLISNENNVDDYIPKQELILHGHGNIQSQNGMKDIPQEAYEIPLLGDIVTTNEKDGLKVETEKAVYKFMIQ
ncbi:hypothetical protein [Halalkalibacter alkalisediminis]|uniref:Uncharacterized protein n=1 Tax=Halalkalibacter alkalisediminis TaxID=935616 RepID=A0ABV6NBD5_9BACI|nr:hypothetical protein [Halalkalibacter alkalisediminis]